MLFLGKPHQTITTSSEYLVADEKGFIEVSEDKAEITNGLGFINCDVIIAMVEARKPKAKKK